jgi:GTPase SAR1 family protein
VPTLQLYFGYISMTAKILPHLQTALELLEIPSTSSMAIDLQTAADRLNRANYQIAVFGAFNHGKSTLLNAILGDKTLPIDLIPTTGGAIKVVYGAEIRTTITLTTGEVVSQSGSEILTEFAILDDDRRMRDDILAIEVTYPHPLLQMGIELIDLPGTNDREEQDVFVHSQILAADLVIYVLDTRKLMTLAEREHLRDWLEQRGMKTVVFVANFMNTLEPADRQEIQQRLRFVAESFRSQIPAGVSNLYQVDALPALRARLKGDDNLLHTSGLPTFVSALQMIFESQQNEVINLRQQLLPPITRQITGLLQQRIYLLTQEVETLTAKQLRATQLKQQAKALIQSGWNQSLQDLEKWLHLPTLISTYQATMILAMQQEAFVSWEQSNIESKLQQFQSAVNNWLVQLASFFEHLSSPEPLMLACPEPPELDLAMPVSTPKNSGSSLDQVTPTAIATGLGWVFGGPIGAAVIGGASILANKIGNSDKSDFAEHQSTVALEAYVEATEDYLCRLNLETMAIVREYRSRTSIVIEGSIVSDKIEAIESIPSQQLSSLQACLMNLSV